MNFARAAAAAPPSPLPASFDHDGLPEISNISLSVFLDTILTIDVHKWLNTDLFIESLNIIPDVFEDEKEFSTCLSPLVVEETRAKLHKCVGDEFENLPVFDRCQAQIFVQISGYEETLGTVETGYMWIPKTGSAQSMKWAKKNMLTLALFGETTNNIDVDKFQPLFSVYINMLYEEDRIRPRIPDFLVDNLDEDKDGHLFKIDVLINNKFKLNANGLLTFHGEVCLLRETLIPAQRIAGAVRNFRNDAPLSLKQAVLNNVVEYTTALFDAGDVDANVMDEALSTMNESQRSAVESILDPYSLPVIQIIKGPPGTGKTKTLVGLIRILTHAGLALHVCAPTNAAVGELARRFFAAMETDKAASGRFRRADFLIFTRQQNVDGKEDNPNNNEITVEDEPPIDPLLESLLPFDYESRVLRIQKTIKALPIKMQEILFALSPLNSNKNESNGESDLQVNQHRLLTIDEVARNIYKSLLEVLTDFLVFIDEYPDFNPEEWNSISEKLVRVKKDITLQFIQSILACTSDGGIGNYTSTDDLPPEYVLANERLGKLRKICNFIAMKLSSVNMRGKRELRQDVFDAAQVIFSTVNVGGRYVFTRAHFDVIIIDEAAQLVLAETTIVLRDSMKCLVLAGDEKQLPATVFSKHCTNYHYNKSLMERLIRADCPSSLLQVQYRMHPDISRWPNVTFYRGLVQDGENVLSAAYTKQWHHSFPPLVITNVYGEERVVNKSYMNEVEAVAVTMTVNNLKRLNIPLHIGIISPYRAQIDVLKSLESQRGLDGISFSVRVSTVDSFQGQECDVIIFSAVRANNYGNIGFLSDTRRLNVALTRAKYCLIVLCNFATVRQESPFWESLLTHAQLYNESRRSNHASSTSAKLSSLSTNLVQEFVARSESRWKKITERLVSFMEGIGTKPFEDAIWDLSISADFKQHVDAKKVSGEQRTRLIEMLLRLVNGEWSARIRSPVPITEDFRSMLFVFECEESLFLWSIELDKRKKKQAIRLWDIGSRRDMTRAVAKVEAHYRRYSQSYLDMCSQRRKVPAFDDIMGSNRLPQRKPGRNLIYPVELGDMDADEFNSLFTTRKEASESSAVANSASFTKFFAFSSDVARFFLRSDEFSQVKLPFKMTLEEDQLVRNNASMFILGRSGTGKTTVLLHRMFLIATVGKQREETTRQLLVTASQSLCDVIAKTYEEMLETNAKMTDSSAAACAATLVEETAGLKTISLATLGMNVTEPIQKANGSHHDGFNGSSPWILTFYSFLLRMDSLIDPGFFNTIGISPDQPPMTLERFKNVYYLRFSESSLVRQADLIYTEIMTTIKGSLESLACAKGFLSVEQYSRLEDRRDSTLNADQRRALYEHFLVYEKRKAELRDFDILDFVFHVFNKLQDNLALVQRSSICMDYVYIDEVQDLVPAQIALFKFIGSQIDGFIFAGDTAQTIANGVGFRFETVKDIFYREFLRLVDNEEPQGDKVPKIWHLTENFRTHSGVVKIANSIVQLLLQIFPSTIDKLPEEYSQIDGPAPIAVEACGTVESLTDNLHANLGADQVILVRDDKTKEDLYAILGTSKGLILTVYEAKGMEFADCLLYNFFTNSPLQNDWRVLYNWIEGTSEACPKFDRQKHERLCVEMKKLYVLLTRAKQHLVIMETDAKWRKPMFDYWLQKEIVTIKRDFDEELQTIFSASSSVEDWSKRGVQFFERKQYANAQLCFERAGDEPKAKLCAAFEVETKAEKLLLSNPERSKQLYKDAGDLFAPLGHHHQAANSYRLAKSFEDAARQFVLCNDHIRAAQCYEEINRLKFAAEQYALAGNLTDAQRCCFARSLFKYLEEEILPILVDKNAITGEEVDRIRADCIRRAALHFHDKKEIPTMMSYVHRFSTSKQMKIFLNRYHHYDQLLDIELKDGNFGEVGRIYEQRKEYQLAAENYAKANEKMTDDCVRCLLIFLQRKCIGERLRLKSGVVDELSPILHQTLIEITHANESCQQVETQKEVEMQEISRSFDFKERLLFVEADVYQSLRTNQLTPQKALTALDTITKHSANKPRWRIRFALIRSIFLGPIIDANGNTVSKANSKKPQQQSSRRGKHTGNTTTAVTAPTVPATVDVNPLILSSHKQQLEYLQSSLSLVQEIQSFISDLLKSGDLPTTAPAGPPVRILVSSAAATPATTTSSHVTKNFLSINSNLQLLEELLELFFVEGTVKSGGSFLSSVMQTVVKDVRAYSGVFGDKTLVNNHHTMQLRELLQSAKQFIFNECSEIVAVCCRSSAGSVLAHSSATSQLMQSRALALSTIISSKRNPGDIPSKSFPSTSDVMLLIPCIEKKYKALVDPSVQNPILSEMMKIALDAKDQLKECLYIPIRSVVTSLAATVELRCDGQSKSYIRKARAMLELQHQPAFRQVGMMHDALAMSMLIADMLGYSSTTAYRNMNIVRSEFGKRKWNIADIGNDSRMMLINAIVWESTSNDHPAPNWQHGNYFYGIIHGAAALVADWRRGGLYILSLLVDEVKSLEVKPATKRYFEQDRCLSPLTFIKLVEKYFVILMLYMRCGARNLVLPLPLAMDVLSRSHPAFVEDMQYLINIPDEEALKSSAMVDVVRKAQFALKGLVTILLEMLRNLSYPGFEKWYDESKPVRDQFLQPESTPSVKETWLYFIESACSLLFVQLAAIQSSDNYLKTEICVVLTLATKSPKSMLNSTSVPIYISNALKDVSDHKTASIAVFAKFFHNAEMPLVAIHVRHNAPPVPYFLRNQNIQRMVLEVDKLNKAVKIVEPQASLSTFSEAAASAVTNDFDETAAFSSASAPVDELELVAAAPPPLPAIEVKDDGMSETEGDNNTTALSKCESTLKALGKQAKDRLKILSRDELLLRKWEKSILVAGYPSYKDDCSQRLLATIITALNMVKGSQDQVEDCEAALVKLPMDTNFTYDILDWKDQLEEKKEICFDMEKQLLPSSHFSSLPHSPSVLAEFCGELEHDTAQLAHDLSDFITNCQRAIEQFNATGIAANGHSKAGAGVKAKNKK